MDRFENFTILISKISRNIKKIENIEMAEYNLKNVQGSCLYYLYVTIWNKGHDNFTISIPTRKSSPSNQNI